MTKKKIEIEFNYIKKLLIEIENILDCKNEDKNKPISITNEQIKEIKKLKKQYELFDNNLLIFDVYETEYEVMLKIYDKKREYQFNLKWFNIIKPKIIENFNSNSLLFKDKKINILKTLKNYKMPKVKSFYGMFDYLMNKDLILEKINNFLNVYKINDISKMNKKLKEINNEILNDLIKYKDEVIKDENNYYEKMAKTKLANEHAFINKEHSGILLDYYSNYDFYVLLEKYSLLEYDFKQYPNEIYFLLKTIELYDNKEYNEIIEVFKTQLKETEIKLNKYKLKKPKEYQIYRRLSKGEQYNCDSLINTKKLLEYKIEILNKNINFVNLKIKI